MSADDRRLSSEQLEAYLDDRMSEREKAEFERFLARNVEAARQVEVQREIDSRLRETFAPPAITTADIEERLLDSEEPNLSMETSRTTHSRTRLFAWTGAVAATIACCLFAWQWAHRRQLEPYFQPRPLAEIYHESVDSGFQPYYFCEDEDRFRLTFAKRQNVQLRLTELPAGRRMVGLSYLGGLSRNTTAILCYAENKPIVVFVDRQDEDASRGVKNAGADVNIFRKQLGDLVLYEVSPLDSVTILDFLEIPRDSP